MVHYLPADAQVHANTVLCRALLRARVNAPLFFIFNVLFISLAQSLLLFLITTPVYPMLLSTLIPTAEVMSTADNVFVRGMMILVIIEYFADQTQWSTVPCPSSSSPPHTANRTSSSIPNRESRLSKNRQSSLRLPSHRP